METRYLDLADFLLIAEAVTGIAADVLARAGNLPLAESALNAPAAEFGGVEVYPDLATKAAVLCHRLAKNHPLPDGNKRTAYICTVEFVERNGQVWSPPPGDDPGGAETVEVMKGVAAGAVELEELTEWILDRLRTDSS